MATIDQVVQRIVVDVDTVAALTKVHAYPPDSINQNLQAVVYPVNIRWEYGPMFQQKAVAFDVTIDVLCGIPDGARQVAALVPLCDSIPDALFADEFLSSLVQQWDTITGGLGPREDTGAMMLRLTVGGCVIESAL